MITLLKNSPLAIDRDSILVAGQKEFEYADYNNIHGVPLIKPIVDELIREGDKVGVKFPIDKVINN